MCLLDGPVTGLIGVRGSYVSLRNCASFWNGTWYVLDQESRLPFSNLLSMFSRCPLSYKVLSLPLFVVSFLFPPLLPWPPLSPLLSLPLLVFFLHAFRHICWPVSCWSILRFWSSVVVQLARMQHLYLPEKAYKSLFLNSPNFQGTINRWNALPDLSWFNSLTQVPCGRESYTLCSAFPTLHWRRGQGRKSWFHTQGSACMSLCRTWHFTFYQPGSAIKFEQFKREGCEYWWILFFILILSLPAH